jgi:hypothetical protein
MESILVTWERVLDGSARSESRLQADFEYQIATRIVRNGANLNICRQEMPIHRSGFHPRSYSDRDRCLHQDAPHPHHSPRIPTLRPQIRQI